jgi:hypothetical protein
MQWQFHVVRSIRQQPFGKINALLELGNSHHGRLHLGQAIAQQRHFVGDGVRNFAMLDPPPNRAATRSSVVVHASVVIIIAVC